MKRRIGEIGLVFLLACLSVWGYAAAGYASFQPGPRGTCLVRKPSISWCIQGTSGTTVTGCTMTLNGKDVSAKYDTSTGAVVYAPNDPMDPGDYNVECTVELNKKYRVKKNWSFKVSPSAIDELPAANAQQEGALVVVNLYRASLGLSQVTLNRSLCASAQAHTKFMKDNNVFGHYQQADLTGFTGEKPLDRAQAFGYHGGIWEDVAMAFETPQGFVKQLFDAPYHRIPFLQPGSIQVGLGFTGNFSCINFGASTQEGSQVSPANGETEVPTSWDGIESPTPLRLHAAKGPVGYVIMLSHFTQANEKIVHDSSSLTCDGSEVPFYLNTPENDDQLNNTILLVPKSPLNPKSIYTVTVKAHTASGSPIEKTWSFTTGSK